MFGLFRKKTMPAAPVHADFAGANAAPVVATFKARRNWRCKVTGSQYIKGHRYRVRKGQKALMERVATWKEEGKCDVDA